MVDKEKVIKGLEICIKSIDRDCPIDCPYHETCTKYEGRVVFQPLLRDTLALLKEQEEIPLRCEKCGYHHEDGWCSMHGIYVEETDYCSLDIWEGR